MEKKLLAVDDEPTILLILQHIFGGDYTVVQKTNGKEALEWMNEGNIPDIIIADVNMPEMDGYEFIKHVRASGFFRNIPLIMLSGNENTQDKIKALQQGADDYLVKPFNPDELKARIANIFRILNRAL
jgi:DNA-binding response OmpR family regulator